MPRPLVAGASLPNIGRRSARFGPFSADAAGCRYAERFLGGGRKRDGRGFGRCGIGARFAAAASLDQPTTPYTLT